MLLLAVFDPWARNESLDSSRLFDSHNVSELASITLADGARVFAAERNAKGMWVTTAPKSGSASSTALARLRSALPLLRSMRQAKERPAHGTREGAPMLTLGFGPEKSVTMHVGVKTANAQSRWIRLGDAERVYLVESHLVAEILDSAMSLRSSRIVLWALSKTEPLRVSWETGAVEIEQTTMRWSGNHPSGSYEAVVDPVRAQHWMESLEMLEETHDEGCVHPPEIRIEQGDNRVQLLSTSCLDPQQLATVVAGLEKPEYLAVMNLLPTRRPQEDFTINCGDTEREIQIGQVDQKALWAWWSGLDTSPRALTEKQGFKVTCTVRGSGWEVALGIGRSGRWLAQSPHASFEFVLDAEALPALEPLRDLFRSAVLIEEDAAFLRRVEIVDAKGSRAVERDDRDGSWSITGSQLDAEAVSDWAGALGRTLGTLQAESFEGADTHRTLAKGGVKLVVEFESAFGDQLNRYHLDLFGNAESCAVSVGDRAPATLATEDCAVLFRR